METNEKKFRYTHFYKNLAILYILFLSIVIIARISPDDPDVVKLVLLSITIAIGVILLILCSTTSVSISETGNTKKFTVATKSLQWSEIINISSQGSSLKLHNNDVVITINSRLYGAIEIFNMLFSKRADLFDSHKNKPFLRSIKNNVGTLLVGLILVILALLLYLIKDYVFTAGYLGLLFCIQAFLSWYSSPRSITLENNSLVVAYLRKSVSIPVDNLESVQIGKTKQGQVTSVFLVFKNKTQMEISGYNQTPLIIYPVLKQWHEKNIAAEPVSPA